MVCECCFPMMNEKYWMFVVKVVILNNKCNISEQYCMYLKVISSIAFDYSTVSWRYRINYVDPVE